MHEPGWRIDKRPSLNRRLHRTNGDVTVILIQKDGIEFTEAVSDPIFATKPHPYVVDLKQNRAMELYQARDSFSAIACVDQVEIYNTRSGRRSLWQSLALDTEIFGLGLKVDKDQVALISFLATMLKDSGLASIPNNGGSTYLDARSPSAYPGIQLALHPINGSASVGAGSVLA